MNRLKQLQAFTFIASLGLGSAIATATALAQEPDQAEETPPKPGYVRVPHGWSHPACVHVIPDGAVLTTTDDGSPGIRDAANRVTHFGRCPHEFVKHKDHGVRNGASDQSGANASLALASKAKGPLPTINGWVEWSSMSSPINTNFTEIQASWVVPTSPATQTNQTIFLFNSLQNGCSIMQPVLQWGPSFGGGGNYWSMANWMVDPACSGQTFVDPTHKKVSVGSTIFGRITSSGCGSVNCLQWKISYTVNGGAATTMTLGPWPANYSDAERATLEVYNLSSCSQLPQYIGDFASTAAWTGTGGNPNARVLQTGWISSVAGGSPWCNYNVLTSNSTNVLLMWN